jgi:hypothetical protein
LTTRDTVALETPAWAATASRVGRDPRNVCTDNPSFFA